MNKIQTYKLGLRYKQLKSCFAEAKKQELLQPGSLLVSGWTVVEVREKLYIRSYQSINTQLLSLLSIITIYHILIFVTSMSRSHH